MAKKWVSRSFKDTLAGVTLYDKNTHELKGTACITVDGERGEDFLLKKARQIYRDTNLIPLEIKDITTREKSYQVPNNLFIAVAKAVEAGDKITIAGSEWRAEK